MSAAIWVVLALVVVAEVVLARTGLAARLPKLVPWFGGAVRGLLALAAAGAAGDNVSLVVLLAVLAAARLGTAYVVGVVRPRMRQSIVAVGVADDYAERFRWSDYTSRTFAPIVAGFTSLSWALDLALGVVGAAAPRGAPLLAAVVTVVALLEAGTHVAGIVLWNRRQGELLRVVAAGVSELEPRVVVYTAALPESVANLEQWLPAVEATGTPAFVLTRELNVVARLASLSSLPVVYIKALGGMEDLLPDSLRVALYVDTSTRNNHLLRNGSLTHVQLHHGDSDKASSSSRLLGLYDHHFVAGPAAVERLSTAGVISSAQQASIVGRPIAASLEPRAVNRAEPIVLYAPTWEGYHQDNAVSSLGLGVAITSKLLAKPQVRTVVRPHPLTGRVDKSMAVVVDQMARLISGRPSAEMSSDPSAGAAIAALQRADVLVTDVSSMLSDFLYTGRPALVVDVADIGADELVGRFPTLAAAYIVRPDLSDFDAKLAAALDDDPLATQRTAVARRTLGGLSGGGVDFATALSRLSG